MASMTIILMPQRAQRSQLTVPANSECLLDPYSSTSAELYNFTRKEIGILSRSIVSEWRA